MVSPAALVLMSASRLFLRLEKLGGFVSLKRFKDDPVVSSNEKIALQWKSKEKLIYRVTYIVTRDNVIKTKVLAGRIPAHAYDQIQQISSKEGKTVSSILNETVEKLLSEHAKTQGSPENNETFSAKRIENEANVAVDRVIDRIIELDDKRKLISSRIPWYSSKSPELIAIEDEIEDLREQLNLKHSKKSKKDKPSGWWFG